MARFSLQASASPPPAVEPVILPLLLTKREAAARLRVSERTLDRLIATGDGPPTTRIAGRVLIREDHLATWINCCSGSPRAAAA